MLRQIRKSKKEDRKTHVLQTMRRLTLDKELWSAVRRLKVGYKPNPYSRKRTDGTHISLSNIAEESAKHLANRQWGGVTNESWKQIPEDKIITEVLECITGAIVVHEVQDAIHSLQRGRASGPDRMAMELLKELSTTNAGYLTEILNEWWASPSETSSEMWQARVALIFKKGSTDDLENYRQISLLNSIYKVYAKIIKQRLERGIETHLHRTQYGFRKNKGTAEAIHCIRRIIEQAEQTGAKTILLLLDWEKAFDKIRHEALKITLQRMNVPEELIVRIMRIYEQPVFQVCSHGQSSCWYKQETGIRQGCPLSPYLFIIVMTAMFEDIRREDQAASRISKRIPNTNFDEILYADDTICVSTDTKCINRRIALIEKHGERYGLKLNKDKCEVLTNATAQVRFADGQLVAHRHKVKYLGCTLNLKADTQREIKSRIGICMGIMRKLDLFWLHARCPIKWKVLVFDAVIRSKLLYGVETAMLTDGALRKINVFQLKGLRKILKLKTTFIDRSNTSQVVLEKANTAIQEEGSHRKVKLFGDAYKEGRMKQGARILCARPIEPTRYTTLQEGYRIWDFPKKRIGRPKDKWIAEGMHDLWERIKLKRPDTRNRQLHINRSKTSDRTNEEVIRTMEEIDIRSLGELQKILH